MQYFGESARALVARALGLAQEWGAAELRPEHLLLSASEGALEQTGLKQLRDSLQPTRASEGVETVEFGAHVRTLFERAYRASQGQVEEVHLLLCLDLAPGSKTQKGPLLGDLFSGMVMETLRTRGVKVRSLVQEIGELSLWDVQLRPSFWASPAGRRIVDLASTSTRAGSGVFALFLGMLLKPGRVHDALKRSGVTEAMLIEILAELSGPGAEAAFWVKHHLSSADLESPTCLGSMAARLSEAARVALIIGWNCAQRQLVGGQNLLDGLLVADILCQPGQGATAVLRRLDVLAFVHSATKSRVTLLDGGQERIPNLSEEVLRALDEALSVAGDGIVSTEHLLYGLAAGGLEELTQQGVTASRILTLLR